MLTHFRVAPASEKGFLGVKKVITDLKWVNVTILILPFSAWCPLKGHTYLNKPAAKKAAGLFKYVWPFSEHQALKG